MTDTRLAWALAQSELATPLLASIVRDPAFEAQHPRGADGRFIEKGGFVKYLDVVASMWVRAKVEDFVGNGDIKIKRSDTGEELVKNKSLLYTVDKPKATLSPSGWKKTGGQAGSNPGGFFDEPNGTKWYVKNPKSAQHVANENLANRLYRAAGAPAPETAVSPNGKQFMTKIEKSEAWGALSAADLAKVQPEIRKNFVVDAWLANWDAPLNDNLRVTADGVPLRVDAGGAVMFRARGGRRQLTPNVGELQSMRDPSISPGGSRLYAGLTRAEEEDGVKRILAISPDTIKSMVKEEGLPSSVATDLIARRAWLATHYGYQLPETTPEGKQLLADLAKKPTDTPAPATAVSALAKKLAPDTAVPLAVGAPVWFKDKNASNVTVVPSGARVPDIMIVEAADHDTMANVTLYTLKSQNGKVQVTDVSDDQFEVLRENFASPASKYAGGESPQVGDRVTGKHGDGTIAELFPLYSRVQLDDGSVKVIRVKSMTRLAQAGSADAAPPTTVTPSKAAAPSLAALGTPADVSDPDTRFPVVAYSVPHRAEVLVLSNDPVAKKSVILLGDGRKAGIADDKLRDVDSVDREAIAALPQRTPGVRAPRAVKPLDVTTLGEKEFQPNRNVKVKLNPGDRLFKTKNRSLINFLKLDKDGNLTFVGSSKYNFKSKDDGTINDEDANNQSRIYNTLTNGTLTDVTPPKYDVAADQLGATHVDTKRWYGQQKLEFVTYVDDPNVDMTQSYARRKEVTETATLDSQPGDRLYSYEAEDAPEWGNGASYKGGYNEGVKKKSNIYLKRGGKMYDLGLNGENAGDPSKWKTDTELTPADFDTLQKFLNSNYWSTYYNTPEPTVTLSNGKTIAYTRANKILSSDGPTSAFNQNVRIADRMSGVAEHEPYSPLSNLSAYDFLKKTFKTVSLAAPAATSPSTDGSAATPAVVAVPAQIPDITAADGFDALKHALPVSRKMLDDGDLDDRISKIVNTTYQPGVNGGHRIEDGTEHFDPYMAAFAAEIDGNQKSLVIGPAAFNAIRTITNQPVLHRGVATAAQRDAMKYGDHFNGVGVYGNGVYTSNRASTTRGYGSATAAMTPKPGSKGIDFNDAVAEQAEARAVANAARTAALATSLGMPTLDEISSKDMNIHDPKNRILQLLESTLSNASVTLTWDDVKDQEQVKAAAAYLEKLRGTDGLIVNATWERQYYGSSARPVLTVTDSKTGGSVQLTFAPPTASTKVGRAHGIQANSGFTIDAKLMKAAPGKPDLTDNYGYRGTRSLPQARGGVNTMSDVTAAIDSSGVGDVLAANAGGNWDQLRAQLQKYDDRISFISDPGRYALAAGYDYITAPQGGAEVYYVFTHRPAMIFRK